MILCAALLRDWRCSGIGEGIELLEDTNVLLLSLEVRTSLEAVPFRGVTALQTFVKLKDLPSCPRVRERVAE
jgi:hypothetical protein